MGDLLRVNPLPVHPIVWLHVSISKSQKPGMILNSNHFRLLWDTSEPDSRSGHEK
jgi:hypothetical protein